MLCFAWHPQFQFPNAVKKKSAKKDLKRAFLLKYIIFLHLYDCWCISPSYIYCHIPNAGPGSALEHLVKTCIFHPKCIILSENVSEGRRRISNKYFKNHRTFPLWILFNYKKYWILKLSISLNNYIIRKINPFFSALALCKK